MADTAQAIRPLVRTTIRTEFGDVLESDTFYANAARDLTYVPGYSDLRRARDLAKGLPVAEKLSLSADPEEVDRGQQAVTSINASIRRHLATAGVALPQGRLHESDIPALPVRLQWARVARVSGAPDSVKQVKYGVDGYRTVTKADLGQSWFRELPAGATESAGGEIRLGDCVLMVTDAKTAARLAAEDRGAVTRMTQHAAPELMRLGASVPGSDPTFEATPGRVISGPPSAIKG